MARSQPQRFGKYTLGAKVAQGGMAEIFRARFGAGAGLTKHVIIKRILPRYAEDERFIQMFATEARIAMGLSHGNIAQVFDFGEIGGAWFLAMELVEGQSLSAVLDAARAQGVPALPPHLAAMVMAEVLKGLHYAHTRVDERDAPLNIVHRDVSPQNVLLSYEGQVKLVDFGIARARHATDKTQAGVIKGKYLYFSPEQIKEAGVDARTDVFAAGSVLYRLLTGHHPFRGEVADVMRDIVRGNFLPPRERDPDLPQALEAIVLKAMATRVEDRYQSAAELERALTGWLHTAAPGARAEELGELVRLLFATELATEGRAVQPDPAFVEEFNSWKRETDAEEPTSGETRSERKSGSERKSSSAGGAPRAPVSRRRATTLSGVAKPSTPRSAWLLAPAVAAVVGLAGWLLLQPAPVFELRLTSDPPGAAVRVDGVLKPGVTPLSVQELPVEVPHLVQLSLAGRNSWQREARGKPGEVAVLHAELEKLPEPRPAPPPAPPAPPAASPAPPTPELVHHVRMPFERAKVLVKGHAKNLERSSAARIDLDPKKTYRAWIEGKVSMGGRIADIWVQDCFFVLEGPKVLAHEAFGLLTRKPQSLRGASRLYAFISDTSTKRHSGAFKVVLEARGERPQRLLVDAVTHNLMPLPEERLTITNLSPLAHYKVSVHAGKPPARTHARGRPGRVLFGQEAGLISPTIAGADRRPHRVLEAGKSYDVSGADFIWLWFPDDDPADSEGSVEVTVELDRPIDAP